MNVYSSIPKWVDTFINFLKSDLCPTTEFPIVVGGQELFGLNGFIFYNTEQLSRKTSLQFIVDCIASNHLCKEIWDYSKANVDILNSLNLPIKCLHVTPKLPESYLNIFREYRRSGQEYDIGFCGAESTRRYSILNSLSDLGYKVLILRGVYGDERDKMMSKCKIILNIHYADDYNIFEVERCEPFLATGVTVISETSLDDDPRCINVSYDNIISKTVEVLKNYS